MPQTEGALPETMIKRFGDANHSSEASVFAESNPNTSGVTGETDTGKIPVNGESSSDQEIEQPERSNEEEVKPVDKPHGINNPDAIPTAGGVKVRQQHFSESQKEINDASREREQGELISMAANKWPCKADQQQRAVSEEARRGEWYARNGGDEREGEGEETGKGCAASAQAQGRIDGLDETRVKQSSNVVNGEVRQTVK